MTVLDINHSTVIAVTMVNQGPSILLNGNHLRKPSISLWLSQNLWGNNPKLHMILHLFNSAYFKRQSEKHFFQIHKEETRSFSQKKLT